MTTILPEGALTRDRDFRKASLHGSRGQTLATSSGIEAERLGFAKKELGSVMVVAAEADDPLLADYRKWHWGTRNLDTVRNLADGKTLPMLATVLAGFNLYANTIGATHLYSEGEKQRFYFGVGGALADLAVAANNVAIKILADSNRTSSRWYVISERRGFQITGFWAKNLIERTGGSALLSFGRTASALAMGLTAALFLWDAGRALRDGAQDIAAANLVAATGSGIWALYTIGLLASPWLLVLGVGLLVSGAIGTALLTDGAVEQAIKHGPFGTEQHLPHMNDPLQAYQQLLGALGEPRVRLERLQRWQQQSSQEDLEQLQVAQQQASIQLEPSDWVVELSTPVLGYLGKAKDCRLVVVETENWNRQLNPRARLEPIQLDKNRLLFIYPTLHDKHSMYSAHTYRHHLTYNLKVFIQLDLGKPVETKTDLFSDYDRIILPQPLPRKWQKFNPGHIPNVDTDAAPYWLIAQRVFLE